MLKTGVVRNQAYLRVLGFFPSAGAGRAPAAEPPHFADNESLYSWIYYGRGADGLTRAPGSGLLMVRGGDYELLRRIKAFSWDPACALPTQN